VSTRRAANAVRSSPDLSNRECHIDLRCMQQMPWKLHGLISFADAYDFMDFNRRAKKRKLKEIMFGVNELSDVNPDESAMSDEHV